MQVQSLIKLGSSFHNFGAVALKDHILMLIVIYLWEVLTFNCRLNANYILWLENPLVNHSKAILVSSIKIIFNKVLLLFIFMMMMMMMIAIIIIILTIKKSCYPLQCDM